MIDPATQVQLKDAIADCIDTDQGILNKLREEIRPLRIHHGGYNLAKLHRFLLSVLMVVITNSNLILS